MATGGKSLVGVLPEADCMSKDFTVGSLPIPKRLLALIDSGFWPRTSGEERKQILHPLVTRESILLFAPEEERIYFVKPPFHTIEKRANRIENEFWAKFGAPEGVSPELSISIGDFGLESDSPILLDYRQDRSNPTVIRLKWRKPESNVWVRCANSFDEFADMLGLGSSQ
jgi:hypothetical protein